MIQVGVFGVMYMRVRGKGEFGHMCILFDIEKVQKNIELTPVGLWLACTSGLLLCILVL